jgi:uncharacterized protein (UPF0276 family)
VLERYDLNGGRRTAPVITLTLSVYQIGGKSQLSACQSEEATITLSCRVIGHDIEGSMTTQRTLNIVEQFQTRVSHVPTLGIGLSVDLYTPDLFELIRALEARGLPYGYFEIFKGSQRALSRVRRTLPTVPLTYHAEGLWVTQPELREAYPLEDELRTAVSHVTAIGAPWLTHECATKQMAGYSFGTYLPPLFTAASAQVTAANIRHVQTRLDQLLSVGLAQPPLFLLETPPLTYFAFGDLNVADFFRAITAEAFCGIVLDIGHLWTIYRYTGEWKRRSLAAFLSQFLDRFPLERVVEIHLAGLGSHESTVACDGNSPGKQPLWPTKPPLWIDAHERPIPEVLFDMLEQVISQSRLVNLKGIALEVDNKPVEMVVDELERFARRFADHLTLDRDAARSEPDLARPSSQDLSGTAEHGLITEYQAYVRAVSESPWEPVLATRSDHEDLARYQKAYLPHEILQWGGNLQSMFPETCHELDAAGIQLAGFLGYWFREPRPAAGPYDFFVLKLERFVAYVDEVLPGASGLVQREAAALREGYETACT